MASKLYAWLLPIKGLQLDKYAFTFSGWMRAMGEFTTPKEMMASVKLEAQIGGEWIDISIMADEAWVIERA